MYPHDVEPWEKNITTLVDFHDKWESLIDKSTPIPTPAEYARFTWKGRKKQMNKIGAYEGAGYSLHGVYRPMPDCRMRSNTQKDFCPACQKALRDVINFYTEE